MQCAISGEIPQDPVLSKKSGLVYEKNLIEKYIQQNGTEPSTNEVLTVEDLIPIKTSRVVRPRPPALTSIPALLATFQNEWDALALETYNLREQLARTREELTTALYQQDAAVRVIARLVKERDEARDALSKVTVSAVAADNGSNGDTMAVDTQGLPEELVAKVEETHQRLFKSRKKRPVPAGWAKPEEVSKFETESANPTEISQVSSLAVSGDYATVSGADGNAAVYALEAGKVERSLTVGAPVTDSIWAGSRLLFSTSKGSVKVFDSGEEVASLSEHAGPATGLSLHPSGDILASVGADKSIVFYDLDSLKPVARSFTDSVLTTCAFHPDGHLFAAGTSSGAIQLFKTDTLELAATFELGAPIEALVFSENGYWFAATAKAQTTVTIFDLRKEGNAAKAKVLEIGGSIQALSWDYTGQFLATVGTGGTTVQQYSKSSKKWSEPLRTSTAGVNVQWGEEAHKLAVVDADGVVTVLAAKEE